MVRQAKDATIEDLLSDVEQMLESSRLVLLSAETRKSLKKALLPSMRTLELLHYQEASYVLQMIPASDGGIPQQFNPDWMEDMQYGEDNCMIKASFFPAVYKIENTGDDANVSTISRHAHATF